MTPTQFEKHAGRGACKKWKISVRLLEADGTSRPIKQWLDVRAFFAFMLTSSLAVSVHPLNISTVRAVQHSLTYHCSVSLPTAIAYTAPF